MLNRDYITEFIPDLEEFREKTMQFHNKEISVKDYKGFSGGYGSYAQRGGDKHMLRLRMAGGRITKQRMKCIKDICNNYNFDLLKLTTCQSIQLHNLEAEELCKIIEEAWRGDMISRGGGGDFPRNVMATTLSGIIENDTFDVLPYAEAAASYLMHYIKEVKFPRKLKVAFSASPDNETHATYRDLGFVARENNTFDVYCAGGLGNNPKLGVKVAEKVNPQNILYYIEAMVRTFVANGNYENRAKSRTRYLQETLGVEGLKEEFNKNLQLALNELKLEFSVEPQKIDKRGQGTIEENKRVIAQKQSGLYSVFYQPVGGAMTPKKMVELISVIEDMEDVEMRITPNEAMYIVNCTADEVKKVLEATSDSALTLFDTSVACIGASICQVGLRDSQDMLHRCLEEVRKENFKDGVLPQVHFSGCPSSCAAHQTAAIGFRGAVKPSSDGPKPAFAIFLGGCSIEGREVIAPTGKPIICEDIPKFLVELGQMITKEDSTYEVWIKNHLDDMNSLIEKYTA